MIGGEKRNLSNNTAMLRGMAQLFVHILQSMHMPQPKIILKKRGPRERVLELYGVTLCNRLLSSPPLPRKTRCFKDLAVGVLSFNRVVVWVHSKAIQIQVRDQGS